MIGLPRDGQKVKIWPAPGRQVQDGPRPVDQLGGGRFLAHSDEGRLVEWNSFYLQQLKCGDIMLHPYKPTTPLKVAAPAVDEVFDPGKALADHMKALEPEAKVELKAEEVKAESKAPVAPSKKDKE
jgi:hypothetical protein